MKLRSAILTAHLWTGFVSAPFLLVLGLSGAVLVFEDPITDAINAPLTQVQPAGQLLSLGTIEDHLRQSYPGYRLVDVTFPADPRHSYVLDLAAPGGKSDSVLFLDPYTGKVLGTGDQAREPVRWVHQLHTRLLAGKTGSLIVAIAALALIFLSLTGIVLWWPAKIVSLRRTGSGKRVVFELHNALGIYSWIFLMIFAVTAAIIQWEDPFAGWISALTHSAPAPSAPGRVSECAGKVPLGAEPLEAAATAVVPGASPAWLLASLDPEVPVRVAMKFPEDHTPAGRTRVYLAGCTGKVVALVNSRTAPLSYRIPALWNRQVHTGDLFGWPTRLLACVFSLSLPVMAVTGPLIWWTRRRRQGTEDCVSGPEA